MPTRDDRLRIRDAPALLPTYPRGNNVPQRRHSEGEKAAAGERSGASTPAKERPEVFKEED